MKGEHSVSNTVYIAGKSWVQYIKVGHKHADRQAKQKSVEITLHKKFLILYNVVRVVLRVNRYT